MSSDEEIIETAASLENEDEIVLIETNEVVNDVFASRKIEARFPNQVIPNQCQHLNRVLQPRMPLVPDAVQLGPEVQDLTHALEVIKPELVDQEQLQPPQDGHVQGALHQALPRRSTRLDIDYEQFNSYGDKIPLKRP